MKSHPQNWTLQNFYEDLQIDDFGHSDSSTIKATIRDNERKECSFLYFSSRNINKETRGLINPSSIKFYNILLHFISK